MNMPRRFAMPLALGYLLSLVFVITAIAAPKIPKSRLSNGVYTSPGGGYAVRVPTSSEWGGRAEEVQPGPQTHGVMFTDDFGHAFYILVTDNSKTEMSLDSIATEYSIGELLREKEFVKTTRGAELRLVGINKGGCPTVVRTKKDGKWVEEKEDAVEAWSLFLQGDNIFQVTAGVPLRPTEGLAEAQAVEAAKQGLHRLLEGLAIPAPPAKR